MSDILAHDFCLGPTSQLWPDENGPWLLTLRWQLIKGRAECVGISVASVYEDSTPQGRKLPEIGTALTTTVLRNLKLAEIVATHREMNAYLWGELAGEQQLATASSRPANMTRPRRRQVVTRELAKEIAEVYRAAHASGRPPTVAVAEHFRVSHSTAARWVAQARKFGELGPAAGTKAGEVE